MPKSVTDCFNFISALSIVRNHLTLPAPCMWCLKRFYEGLKGFHKTFSGTTKKCENKNLS